MKTHREFSGRTLPRRIGRFVLLLSASLAAISLLAFIEGLLFRFWHAGFLSDASPREINISDFSVSSSGEWGVSRVTFYVEPCRKTLDGWRMQSRAISDVLVYDLRTRTAKRLRIHGCCPRHVAIAPRSGELAVACEDKCVRILSDFAEPETNLSKTAERLRLFARTPDRLGHLAFTPDNELLLGIGRSCIYVWRWPTGEFLHNQPLPDPSVYPRLACADDGGCILSFPLTGEVYLWDAHEEPPVKLILPGVTHVWSAALAPDGELAALCLSSGDVRVYRLASGEELWRHALWRHPRSNIRSPLITFSHCGRYLAKTDSHPGTETVIVFDAISGDVICELHGDNPPITGLAPAPDGLLYGTDAKGFVRAWNLEEKREQWRFSTLEWGAEHQLFREDR